MKRAAQKKGKTKGDLTLSQAISKESAADRERNVFNLYELIKAFERYVGKEYLTYDEGTRVNKFRVDVQSLSTDMIAMLRIFHRIDEPDTDATYDDSSDDDE